PAAGRPDRLLQLRRVRRKREPSWIPRASCAERVARRLNIADSREVAMSCRIVVIGNGGFAVRCLKMLRAAPRIEVPLAVADPKAQVLHGVLESYCASVSLPLVHVERINAPEVVEAVRAVGPDYLLNAYSMQLIGPELLSL